MEIRQGEIHVANIDKYTDLRFRGSTPLFIYQGINILYPNPIKDGLQLWYSAAGRRNTDADKGVLKDLSGNGNDGVLHNFNYTEESGYKDNTLVFDGIDDKLTVPELALDETAMSVVHDGEIYAYEDDKVLTVGEDGEIVGSGKNLYGNHIVIEKDQTEGALTLVRNHPNAPFGFYTVGARGNISFVQLNNIFPQAGIYTVSWEIEGNQNTASQNAISTHEGVASELFVNPSTSNEAKKFSYTFEVTDISTQNWLRFDRLSWLWYYFKYIDVRMVSQPVEFSPNPSDLQKTTFAPSHLKSMQIYNKPLLKEELLHNAESKGLKELKPGVVVQDGLVLHYDFSHESNTSEYKGKAFDYSGNGNHGTLQNFGYAEGSGYDEGLIFDGVDDCISTLQTKKISLTRGVSAEAVVRVSEPGGVFTGRDSSFAMTSGYRFLLQCQAERYFRVRLWGQDWAENLYFYTPSGKDVAHISFTYDLNKLKVYTNGVLVIEQVFNQPLFDYYDEILVGRYGGGGAEYMSGEVYSSRTYNRPLTPEEIAHNYAIEKEKFGL